MALLIVFGKYMWGFDFSKNDPFYYKETTETYKRGQATEKCKMYTMLFETFVFLQIFNEFNCRMIQPKKFNMFSNLLSNWYFLIVVFGTAFLTLFFVEHAGSMMRVTALEQEQHAACLIWGASVLVVSTALKLTPPHWVERLPIFLDENK